jgi:glutamate racemase
MTGPVGIFDSGVGGLSVLREIRRQLPHEDLIYVADSKHAPYGNQPAAFIEQRAFAIAEFLLERHAKAIVVACNTATSVAVRALRDRWTIPIVAIEPAIKPAAALTRSGVVGVLATTQTIASPNVARLVERVRDTATVVLQACPGLVEQIERGEFTSQATRSLVERYVTPLLATNADVLVLGCTHYPLIIDVIRRVAGPDVTIIDPAEAVARELRRRLMDADLLSATSASGALHAWSTAQPDLLRAILTQLGFADIAVSTLVTP